MTKDYGQSVRAKLLNVAKADNQEFMKVLGRYFQERILYRISVSRYKQQLLLKGSSLLYAHHPITARPTIDLDLLGKNISNKQENIKEIFKEILVIPCKEDGVTFDIESINPSPIAIEKKYPGTTLSFIAHLHSINYQVSIDIGFGDIVTPRPMLIEYPLLIKDMPVPEVYSYSLETLIAEKFQAMIDRDVDNSRMKDFYDLYQLFCYDNDKIDRDTLGQAIKKTFANRNTSYSDKKHLFNKEFATDVKRNQQWKTFLKRQRLDETIQFTEVMDVLRNNLSDYWTPDMNKGQ